MSDATQALPTTGTMTPREIVQELDKHIVGQSEAKRAVAIALRNRWRRMQLDERMAGEITPKNILMIGPTGVGKTEIARRLAKLARAPFIKVEATKFTEVGYVGREVDSIIRDLVDAAVKMERETAMQQARPKAELAAEERVLDALVPRPREYGGERSETREQETGTARQVFRKRLREGQMDDTEIEVEVQMPTPGVEIMTPPGMEEMASQMQGLFQNLSKGKTRKRKMTVKQAMKEAPPSRHSGPVQVVTQAPKDFSFDPSSVEVVFIRDQASNKETPISKVSDRYIIKDKLGEGGMAVVYRAIDKVLDREVAMKFLPEGVTQSSKILELFEKEAKASAGLNHPNVITVFDYGVLDGRPFICMELLRGCGIDELLEPPGTALDLFDVIDIMEGLLRALEYAHSKRIVHRDVKPANIMIGAYGEVYVMDWGLARYVGARGDNAPDSSGNVESLRHDTPGWTLDGAICGTPNYMPPEQVRSAKTADERSDDRARAQAARRLVPLRGQWARVALAHYHLAASRDGTRQVGFWEVRAVDGLPAEAHWAPQRAYYHVTDKASLVGCNAATAFEVLRALRRGDLHPDWRITTLPTQPGHEPYSVAGEVKVHG